jgi:50S ribosomal subunit-associated GTPase HflX
MHATQAASAAYESGRVTRRGQAASRRTRGEEVTGTVGHIGTSGAERERKTAHLPT